MTSMEVLPPPHASPITTTPLIRRPSWDDDEEESVASIRAMNLDIGSSNGTKHDTNAPGPSTYNDATRKLSTGSSTGNAPRQTKQSSSSLRSLLGVPPTSSTTPRQGSMLGVPPSTSSLTAPPGVGGASGARIGGSTNSTSDTSTLSLDANTEKLPSEIAPKRKKVVLGPGCSALDWARTKSTITSKGFRKIKPSELKLHKSKDDAWSAFNGKVYDMTPYFKFHPGGQDELMRVAGRDGTRLFMLTHSWVNIDSMIDTCIVGVLVSESA